MPKDAPQKGWLGALVAAELDRYDAAAALARVPTEARDAGDSATDLAPAARLLVARSLRRRRIDAAPPPPAAAFMDDARLHVGLLLDLALLRGVSFDSSRRRAEIAAFLAAAVGAHDAAMAVGLDRSPAANERGIDRAFRVAEKGLLARFHPPGDPVRGLPLHPGHLAVFRRLMARVAMGFHRHGTLDAAALARHAEYSVHESVLLAEAMAGLLRADGAPDARTLAVRRRQLVRLALPRTALRTVRRAVTEPRRPEEIASAAPERVRPFLVEQLLLALLRAHLPGDAPRRFVDAFAGAAAIDPATLVTAQVEAAAQHGDHHVWFEVLDQAGAPDWPVLAGEWEATADQIVERVSSAVADNLGAVVTEIRQTGELGQLLARAAGGRTLSADEKRKVRAQLVDLAKAVPALAIFAAPGGMLLLPLLAKLLPFNLLPSAWDKPPGAKGPDTPEGASGAGGTGAAG